MRQLTPTLFNDLKQGSLQSLLEYVREDDTLDLEFRGNSFTIYYRGGALLIVEERGNGKYTWKGLAKEYILKGKNKYEQKYKHAEYFEEYIPEAKHIMDRYICLSTKNHLAEKEIQQLVVKENNYSPNSQDTDYFILDMEYEESKDEGRTDLIALRWDSNQFARKSNKVSLAFIEVKQGYNAVRTRVTKDGSISPGLKEHMKDYTRFIDQKKADGKFKAFCDDMSMIFKQKCELGLIVANKKIENLKIADPLYIEEEIDFICLLSNYKKASDSLRNELNEMGSCKFIRSHYMGYGLYADEIFTLTSEDLNLI